MKNLLLFASLFFTIQLSAQTCLSGGAYFTDQQEIDDFAINYPGCTTILGKLTIREEEIR